MMFVEGAGAEQALFALDIAEDRPSLFTLSREHGRWTQVERVMIRALRRSLNLAVQRSHATQRLEQQNAELEARTRALEGFADSRHRLSKRPLRPDRAGAAGHSVSDARWLRRLFRARAGPLVFAHSNG
ncbi:hypothetical protein [Deinococcus xinjiangensis]|uniref:hypothetical protein n=1 Tax=Deinococcus xinjiangensis TaxID=457454 RepID=UPI003365A6D3